jgi:hypothetical protein
METHPPLETQLFQILDKDPTKKYDVDSLLKELKSSPHKREAIKTLNGLIKDKKILRLEDDAGKSIYRTNAYIPKNAISSTNVKLLFLDMDSFPNILEKLEDKCWKKFRIFGFASLNFNGYGNRLPVKENLKIIQYSFDQIDTQLIWSLQEVINTYKTHNEKLDICIASNKDFKDVCKIIESRGYIASLCNKEVNLKEWFDS